MSASTFLYAGLAPVVFLVFWIATAFLTSSSFPAPRTLHNARIVLLIAHPDDEAMFFSPTLLALTDPSLGNHVKILCLSTGNADGLGETRKTELIDSAMKLGVRRKEDIFILDDGRFVDGLDQDWNTAAIAQLLAEAFAPAVASPKSNKATPTKGKARANVNAKTSSTTAPEEGKDKPSATIDVLITFDAGGVSNHPNHRALYGGAVLFLKNLMRGYSGWECPVALYTLPTVNILRKYSSVLDALVTMTVGAVSNLTGAFMGDKTVSRAERGAERVLFMSGLQRYWRAREAMVKGHTSQMVWFRWGWITVGRYMVVNDLKRERIAGSWSHHYGRRYGNVVPECI
jgi:N-acetylglucosaminylphosphatidylinositol deacetylase